MKLISSTPRTSILTLCLALLTLLGWQQSAWFKAEAFNPTSAVAVSGAALNFDGTDDYVNLGTGLSSAFNGTNKITIQAWVYPTAFGGLKSVISNLNISGGTPTYWMRMNDEGKMQFSLETTSGGVTVTTGAALSLNAWKHITATWDGSTIRIYVNGVLDGSQAQSGAFPASSNTVTLGISYFDTTQEQWQGALDEVRVWNNALNQTEIQANYNRQLTCTESGLLAYYKFNQGMASADNSGVTTLIDSSPNVRNGTLSGFALTGATSNWVEPGSPLTPTPEFHVNVTNDEADPGAMEGDGDLSLREAIILANAAGSPATVHVPAGTYALTRTGSFEDNALTGDLDLKGNVTITGAGAATTIIDAGGAAGLNDRVFHLVGYAEGCVSGVTITGGVQFSGAGVYSDSGKTLNIVNCDIRGNSGFSAGVYFEPNSSANPLDTHTLTIVGSLVRDNVGAGITVEAFAFEGQSVSVNFSILNSNVSGNRDSSRGIGILLRPSSNRDNSITTFNASIVNTTISGNGGSFSPGGVSLESFLNTSGGATCTTTLNLINSTITGNTSQNSSCCSASGLYASAGTRAGSTNRAFVNLSNTIIAGNLADNGTTPSDCKVESNTTLTGFNNLIGDAATAGGLQNGVNGNLVGVGGAGTRDINTVLNTALANNGGPTLTHALVAGSAALNAGDNSRALDSMGGALTTDQRGAGFPRLAGGTVDIGAFEFNNAPPTITAQVGVMRAAGATASNSQIATVNDAEDAENTLAVRVNDAAMATVNGVTVSNLAVSAAGVVTANVVADCAATTAMFTLKVTDSGGVTATATLTVTVNANTPPVLSYANPAALNLLAGATVNPASGPSDNGSVATLAVHSKGTFTGEVTVANGVVTLSNAGPAGTHTITIRATDNCGGLTGTTDASFQVTVNQANTTTTLATSVTPSVYGQSVTFTATVAAVAPVTLTPNGTVSFTVDGTPQPPVTLNANGQAQLTLTTLAVGARTISADYNGAANFNPSNGTLAGGQTVEKVSTTTTLSATPNPAASGQAVTVSFTVTPAVPGPNAPGGEVTVTATTGESCQATVATGTCILTFNTLGARNLTATYAGDASRVGSASSATPQNVNCPVITVIPPAVTTATAGQPFSATFTQSGGVGAVNYSLGGATPTPTPGAGPQLNSARLEVNIASMTANAPGSAEAIVALGGLTGTALVTQFDAATKNFSVSLAQAGGLNAAFTLPAGPHVPTYAGGALNIELAFNSTGFRLSSGAFDSGQVLYTAAGVANFNSFDDLGPTAGFVLGASANGNGADITATVNFDRVTLTSGETTHYFSDFNGNSGGVPNGWTDIGSDPSPPSTVVESGTVVAVSDFRPHSGDGGGPQLIQSAFTFTPVVLAVPTARLSAQTALAGDALPPGLTLAPDGTLSGTPTQNGNFTFAVKVTDSNGCTGQTDFTLQVGCPALTMTPATLPGGVQSTPYRQTLNAGPAGTTYSYAVSIGGLPPGLSLNSTTGVLSGTPASGGLFSFAITATGWGGCTVRRSYSLLITGTCAPITVNPASLAAGTLGTAFSQTFSATGGSGSYRFGVTSGALPGGLSLSSSTGVLSGAPTASGFFSFRVTATDAGGCTGSRQYVLTIGCSPLTFSPASLPNGLRGGAYSQQLSVTPTGVYTFSLLLGSLPPGFTLSNAGLLSGTSNQAGTYNFTVKAQTGSCQGTKAYTLVLLNGAAALAQRADYDGDGRSDFVLWSPSGEWQLSLSNNGAQRQSQTHTWGSAGDLTLWGDYDGDGLTDLAVWRPRNGTWHIKRSRDGSTLTKAWGTVGDVPVPGDYDGDGQTDLAVFRPSAGHWYVLSSRTRQTVITAWGAGVAPYYDVAVPGDYDGDGQTDLAVFRRATGEWWVKRSRDGQPLTKLWGLGTDTPVAADYDGDGKTDWAVWRQGSWYIWASASQSLPIESWGNQAAPYFDQAVSADYDGDGLADITVWRAGDSTWYVRPSSTKAAYAQPQGQKTDKPVTQWQP